MLLLKALLCLTLAPEFHDPFDGDALHERWDWHAPVAGPVQRVAKGALRIEIPARRDGFNLWTGLYNAPLLTTPATGDWDLLAQLRLVEFDPRSGFHAGVVAVMSERHVVSWGPFGGGDGESRLAAEITGRGGLVNAKADPTLVQLKLEKRGETYRCYWRKKKNAWQRAGEFTNPFPPRAVGLHAKTFGRGSKLVVDVSSFRFVPVESAPVPPLHVDVKLDPIHARVKLDPRRYGQFIEHLGDCIYGGMWAEMLRNRKFAGRDRGGVIEGWEGIGAGHSPDAGDAYVREGRSQRIAGRGGIRQGGLKLRAGKEYVGRAVLKGAAATVSLRQDEDVLASEDFPPSSRWEVFTFRFRCGVDTDGGAFEVTTREAGTLRIGCVSLMPADNVDGWNRSVLEAVKRARVPYVRWPGGNFVSGYDWRDGLGDRDRRPVRWERAWRAWETNDVGTHEFFRLCELMETEPYLCLNLGEGTPVAANEWVKYCVERWKLPWIGLGNEIYGHWQIGRQDAPTYAKKAIQTSRLVRRSAPKAKLVLVGVESPGWGDWNRVVMREAGKHADYLSVHFYENLDLSNDPGVAHLAVMSANGRLERMLKDTWQRISTVQPRGLRRRPLCLDEWNVVLRAENGLFGGQSRYPALREGIFAAGVFHSLHRRGARAPLANLAMMVNVAGAYRTNGVRTIASPIGLAFELYREFSGDLHVDAEWESPPLSDFDRRTPALDLDATLSDDRGTLYLTVINRHPTRALTLAIEAPGYETGTFRSRAIVGAHPAAANTFAEPDAVRIVDAEGLRVQPHSIQAFAFRQVGR